MEDHQEGFLAIRLNAAGASHLKRVSGITRWLFLIGVLESLMLLVNAVMRSFIWDPEKYKHITPLYLELKFHSWFVIICSLAITGQLFLYLRFVRRVNKAMETVNTEGFNDSFQFLYSSNLLAFVSMVIGVLMGGLNLWMNYIYLTMTKR